MADTSDIKVGSILRYNGELCQVTEYIHRTPGNLRAFYQVKMRNLKSGKVVENRFRAGEQVELARVEFKEMQYLYPEGENMVVMDPETYDQVYISKSMFGENADLLKEEMVVKVAFEGARNVQIWDLNIGVLYVTAVSSIGVIGILMAGWSSNNKYSLLGAMRSGAQIVSYELSAGLAILTIVVLTGSLRISDIIASQADGWWIFKGHIPAIIAFVIFIIAVTAETNRAPFDLAEAESELTAGFHTEYSGMKFALFFLAEYVNIFIVCAIGATLFLGGWMPFHIGHWDAFNRIMDYIPSSLWFTGKTFFLIFLIMWFRWTFPRLRIDQLLNLEWKYLLPISLFNLLLVTLVAILGWYF